MEWGLILVSGVGCRLNGVFSKQSISQKFSYDLDELLCVVLRRQTNQMLVCELQSLITSAVLVDLLYDTFERNLMVVKKTTDCIQQNWTLCRP